MKTASPIGANAARTNRPAAISAATVARRGAKRDRRRVHWNCRADDGYQHARRHLASADAHVRFDLLALTPKTVRNYVSAVLSKLQVVDRAEAILRARAAGLG